jgi:hypothetical protein
MLKSIENWILLVQRAIGKKEKNQRCKVSKNMGGLRSPKKIALIKIKPQFTK